MKKTKLNFLLSVIETLAVLAAIGFLLWFCFAPEPEMTLKTSEAHANRVIHDAGSNKAVAPAVKSTAVQNRAAHTLQTTALPQSRVGKSDGKILASRVAPLPPRKKGGTVGELREWLIEPKEGYTYHVEEEYQPDDKGEMKLSASRAYAANQVLLTVDGETDFNILRAKLAQEGATLKEPLMETEKDGKILAVMVPEITFETVAKLEALVNTTDSRLHAEPDYIQTIFGDTASHRVPNDPRMSSLWGMEKIQAPEAWTIGVSATNVIVAVLDTGSNYLHEDLYDNVLRDQENLEWPWVRGFRCIKGVQSLDPADDNGHGTHCSGTVCGRGNNERGVAGVTWKTNLMPIKWLNYEGKGATSDSILSYRWARKNGAQVLSCSFGGGGYSSASYTAIEQLRIMGAMLACAAGNGGADGIGDDNDKEPNYPSNYDLPNIVAVASSGETDELSEFSNYGVESVDISAPGENILSTCWTWHGSDTYYQTMSGTSMATPHVAGALTLLKGEYPDDVYWQTIQRLLLNGDRIEAFRDKLSTGMRMNLYKAMQSLIPPAPVVTASAGLYEDRVEVSWIPVKGATYYKLWRRWSEGGAMVELTDWTTDLAYTDTECAATGDFKATYGWHYYVQSSKHADGHDASPLSPAACGYKLVPIADDWDPTDDTPAGATVLTPTGDVQTQGAHSLTVKDTDDWFAITATAGMTYVFETTGASDTYAEIFASATTNSEERLAYDDDSGTDKNARLQWTAEMDGVVYLHLTAWDKTVDSFYQLQYSILGWEDTYDPTDNLYTGATEITPSVTLAEHGLHSLAATDTEDWFTAELTEGTTYVFATTGDTDTYAELYYNGASAGALVAWNDDGHDSSLGSVLNARLVYTAEATGTYYLKIKMAPSGGTAGTYMLQYVQQPTNLNFVFATDEEVKTKGWTCNAFFAKSADSTVGTTSFTTDDAIVLNWAFAEEKTQAVGQNITNLVALYNSDGARIAWGHAVVVNGLEAGTFYDFTTEMPSLPAGTYTVKLTLNSDIDGNASVTELTTDDNVQTVAFTVLASASSVTQLEISGNETVPSKESAVYTCTATFGDGSTSVVAPTWAITNGADYASMAADGTLTAVGVSTATPVTMRAVFGGVVASKTVTIRPMVVKSTNFPEPQRFAGGTSAMTLNATVTINGLAATDEDELAVYCGSDIRSKAKIDAKGHATLEVPVLDEGEILTFKVFDASAGDAGEVLACAEKLWAHRGKKDVTISLTAMTNDPFGEVSGCGDWLTGWLRGTLQAQVTINGMPAEAGDILAVYAGSQLIGKGVITLEASLSKSVAAKATCRVPLSLTGTADLSFVVWSQRLQKRYGSSTLVESVVPGASVGTVTEPILVAANDESQQTLTVKRSGDWKIISFNVLPTDTSKASVFEPVLNSLDLSLVPDTIRLGEAYFVQALKTNCTWTVTGVGDTSTKVTLQKGLNLVGYPLNRVGRVTDVLRDALEEGLILRVNGLYGSYPRGNFSAFVPGQGYWIEAKEDCTITFQDTGMLFATGDAGAFGPFGSGEDVVTEAVEPTLYDSVQVKVYGQNAAFGDCVAFYDADNQLRGVARVDEEEGRVTFPVYAAAEKTLTAKIWLRASGTESPTILDATPSVSLTTPEPGSTVSDLVLSVIAAEGTTKTCAVTFDLGAGTLASGSLNQTVAFGGSATAPEVTPPTGQVFDHWSRALTDIRADVTIAAVYRAETAKADASAQPEATHTVKISYDAAGGTESAPMADQTFNFDSSSSTVPTVSETSYTKSGSTLVGWSTSKGGVVQVSTGGGAAEVAAAVKVAEAAGGEENELKLYAVWGVDGFQISIPTFVANTESAVTVPVRLSTSRPLACVSVKVTYDPNMMVLTGIAKGSLAAIFTDDFTATEVTQGTVSVGLFAEENVVAGDGVIAYLSFQARKGTGGLFSDVTIADVQLADETGVTDVTDGQTMTIQSGMVRLMEPAAEVVKLENTEAVAADTTLKTVDLSTGDGIQASVNKTPVEVTEGVTGVTADIPVTEPTGGWTAGRYTLLKTPTTGLSFNLVGFSDVVNFSQVETNDNMIAYIATVGSTKVVTNGRELTLSIDDGSGETQDLQIPTDWLVSHAAAKEGETVKTLKLNLNSVGANGLMRLHSYLLGLDPEDSTAKPELDAPQNTEANSIDIAMTNLKQPTGSGYKVKLEAVKDGATVASGESISINLDSETDPTGHYTFKVNLVPENSTATEIPMTTLEQSVGILKGTSGRTKTAIPVPWGAMSALGESSILISNVVKTATLTVGDKLYVYNRAGKKYEIWTLGDEKTWEPVATYLINENGTVSSTSSGEPQSTTVTRGSAIWLERQDATRPYYLYGQYETNNAPTVVEAGDSTTGEWNLIASPSLEPFDLAEIPVSDGKTSGAKEGDTIVLPMDDGPRVYTLDSEGQWGFNESRTEERTLPDGTSIQVSRIVRNTTDTTIPVGSGFWYVSRGGNPAIKW